MTAEPRNARQEAPDDARADRNGHWETSNHPTPAMSSPLVALPAQSYLPHDGFVYHSIRIVVHAVLQRHISRVELALAVSNIVQRPSSREELSVLVEGHLRHTKQRRTSSTAINPRQSDPQRLSLASYGWKTNGPDYSGKTYVTLGQWAPSRQPDCHTMTAHPAPMFRGTSLLLKPS